MTAQEEAKVRDLEARCALAEARVRAAYARSERFNKEKKRAQDDARRLHVRLLSLGVEFV